MANTHWNPSDLVAVTLTGSNLIATATSSSASWVRAVDTKTTGKWYWEVTMSTWANANTGIGVTNLTSTPSTWFATNLFIIFNAGTGYLSGTQIIVGLGSLPSGSVVGFALDAGAGLIWARHAPSGNWNGSSGYDPATGVGGGAIGAITGGFCPVAEFGATSEVANANFGDSAFVGTVPSGYTSGFPGPVTASAANLAMVLA